MLFQLAWDMLTGTHSRGLSLALLILVEGCQGPSAGLPSIEPVLESLRGLPFDQFLDRSFEQYVRRSPELVLWMGLSEQYGMRNNRLDDASLEYTEQTFDLLAGIQEILQDHQREALSGALQVSFDAYSRFLDIQTRARAFILDDYPINYFNGLEQGTLGTLNDTSWIQSRQDAEDYLASLGQARRKLRQVVERAEACERNGMTLPRFAVDWTRSVDAQVAYAEAGDSTMFRAFSRALQDVPGLSAGDRDDLLSRAEQAIRDSVIPGFQEVLDHLDHIADLAPEAIGLSHVPGGAEAYAFLLGFHTDGDLTADQIHQLGLTETARIQAEMAERFDALGYPAGEGLAQRVARAVQDGGSVPGAEVLPAYAAIIQDASGRLPPAFSRLPETPVEVLATDIGAYYESPALDGSRPGVFFAPTNGGPLPRFGMRTLAYHEAMPGHHLQIALALESEVCFFQRAWTFTALTEGWALYTERLAADLGWYAEGPALEPADPIGDLGRLQSELLRAVRLVVDTGIHALGWSFSQAAVYMRDNVGYPDNDPSVAYAIARYAIWPGQATAYLTGMRTILDLRERSRSQLGEEFDLRQFHNWILGQGNLPLPVVGQVVESALGGKPLRLPVPQHRPTPVPGRGFKPVRPGRLVWSPQRASAWPVPPPAPLEQVRALAGRLGPS